MSALLRHRTNFFPDGMSSSEQKKNTKQKIGCFMGVSENRGTPKSSILIGISIINHPFWGTTIFGNILITKPYKAIFGGGFSL